MAEEAYDFRSFLRERFRAAARRNSRFSLRSFARQLGINHSSLSQILRSKRPLTESTVQILGTRLGLPEEAIRNYAQGVKTRLDFGGSSRDVHRFNFDLDTFQLLSVWYHQAILELTHLRIFKPDSRWISKMLGIGVDEVNVALQRLLRLGLLEMSKRKRWTDNSGDAEFHTPDLTETCGDQVNQEVHELAIDALKRIPSQHRIHSNMVLAIDSKQLPRLKILADEFMNQARTLVSETSSHDDVYYAEVSLFPLTTIRQGEEENG